MNVPGIVLNPTASRLLDDVLASSPHAILLNGPLGTGKTHVANTLAAGLLGVADEGLQNHGYFRLIRPQKDSITIEQIRDLLGFFRLKVPGQHTIKRIAIIEDADTMGHEAQNALLKALEEPPEDSVLILTSSRTNHILPTVRSRAQIILLGSPDGQDISTHFISQGYDAAKVSAALLRSGVNIAAAAQYLQDSGTDDTVTLVKRALSGTGYDRMLLVDSMAKQKASAVAFADTLASVALASLQAAAEKGADTLGRWHTILQATDTAQEALERNGNTKLVLTELMLTL